MKGRSNVRGKLIKLDEEEFKGYKGYCVKYKPALIRAEYHELRRQYKSWKAVDILGKKYLKAQSTIYRIISEVG